MSRHDELYADSAQAREWDRQPRDAFSLDAGLSAEEHQALLDERQLAEKAFKERSKANVRRAFSELEAFFYGDRNKGA